MSGIFVIFGVIPGVALFDIGFVAFLVRLGLDTELSKVLGVLLFLFQFGYAMLSYLEGPKKQYHE